MKEFLEKLFSSDFMPHGYCYLWKPGLVWLHVVSDALAVGLLAVCAGSSRAQSGGETLFKAKCATCHGPDGKADTPAGKSMKIRSFSDPETKKLSDDELAAIIEKGKNKMPAYGKSMKPDEIKAMVAYIRSVAK